MPAKLENPKKAHLLYWTWQSMIQRCHRSKNKDFHKYGARGVSVCARWRDDFWAFVADMGAKPSERHSLDRFPNNAGNYEPGNVRWATYEEQAANMRPRTPKTHCFHGHELAGDNIRVRDDGTRICLTCQRDRTMRRHSQKEARANG